MRAAILLSLFACGLAVGAAAWLHAENATLRERVRLLEQAVGPVASDGASVDAGEAPVLAGSAPRRELAELRGTTRALLEHMDVVERLARERAAAGPGAALDAGVLAGRPAFAEAVRDVVLDLATNDVDFRARVGARDRTKIPKNAPFARVAKALQLDAAQQAQMGKDLQDMQQALFAVLSEERPDGVVPMDLIAKAEALEPGDPKRAETFVKLFTLKIPGADETYMQRAVRLGADFRKRIETYLRPAQTEILDSVEIDWFSIKFQ